MGGNCLHIQTVVVYNGPVTFQDRSDLCPVLLLKEFSRMITDVAKALHDDTFALKTSLEAGFPNILRMTEKFLQAKLYTPAGGFRPSLDSSEIDRLSRDTPAGVDVIWVKLLVFVGDP